MEGRLAAWEGGGDVDGWVDVRGGLRVWEEARGGDVQVERWVIVHGGLVGEQDQRDRDLLVVGWAQVRGRVEK